VAVFQFISKRFRDILARKLSGSTATGNAFSETLVEVNEDIKVQLRNDAHRITIDAAIGQPGDGPNASEDDIQDLIDSDVILPTNRHQAKAHLNGLRKDQYGYEVALWLEPKILCDGNLVMHGKWIGGLK
jgi:hypothetical protein